MIDLHMHSCYSHDGEFTPAKLMERCAAGGIRIMSITDHNTVRAKSDYTEIELQIENKMRAMMKQ